MCNIEFVPLLWQFFLIPNIINKFVYLRTYCITASLDQFCRNLISTVRFISFQLFKSNFSLRIIKLRY